MRHSIPYYIREQLREDRTVAIPGLGQFFLKHHSASLAVDRSEIFPPTVSLNYSEDSGDETPLLARISKVEDFSIQKAAKKLRKYTESIFNSLLNINRADIDGVGTLIRKSDKEIVFDHTIASLTDEYQGFKPLSLTPIKRMSDQNTNKELNAENQYGIENMIVSEEPKPRRPWWIPIIGGLILFAVYLLTMKSCNKDSGFFGFGKSIDKTESIAVADSTLVSIEEAVIEGESELDNVLDDNTTSKDGVKTSKNTDVPSSEEKNVVDSKITNTTSNNNNSNNNNYISYTDIQNGKSIIKSVNYDGERCVIIVGSFKKPKNVLKMQSKVESLGYKVFSEQYNDFTRVGMEFNCSPDKLELYIAEAKLKLAKAAWYLQSPDK